uniref:Methionine aminopeptidase n=1 Tax=Plectus sambesii TaxID=2011161 RepID=A0A914VHV8_9BILA
MTGDSTETDGLDGQTCGTVDCGHPAKLRCPTCIKLNIDDSSYFCSQDCFKGNWNEHKKVHAVKRLSEAIFVNASQYDPWPGYSFTGPLRPYPQSAKRSVPTHIPRPDYALHPQGVSQEEKDAKRSGQIKVLDDEEIEGLKLATRFGRECLDEAAKAVTPGITTDELDRIVHEAAIERDCYPSPLGYYGFPKSCCTSVNEVICHGIPDGRPLENGDLCNVDVTVYHRGFHGDLNETFFVGDKVSEEARKLVKATHECLYEAIKIVRPGAKFRDIGAVIQKHANASGYSVVRSYCGHGIHRLFHTAPNVPHYAMSWPEVCVWKCLEWLNVENKTVGVMKAGNAFTIEPMINAGSHADTQWPDHWTAVTCDGKWSAQFEQTLLVTETGCEILTARREHNGRPWFEDQLEQYYSK